MKKRVRFASFADFHVGQTATLTKTISEDDVAHFIAITGDVNPLHVDEQLAASTFFGGRIVHGMLTASLFSTMVGMILPGPGAIYRSQSIEFLKPVFPGDTLTGKFEVRGIDPEANLMEIASRIENQEGVTVVTGTCRVGLLRQPRKGTRSGRSEVRR